MSITPPKINEDLLSESWIEISSAASMAGVKSPERITPLSFTYAEEHLRLLREAQWDSNQTSPSRNTPRDSPKSPPNSPNNELCNEDELKHVYINCWNKALEPQTDSDWLDEWNSRPDQQPPKGWKFEHPQQKKKSSGYSVRLTRVGKNSLFSREILYSLILSNVLSLLLGAGVGLWLSRRGILFTRVVID